MYRNPWEISDYSEHHRPRSQLPLTQESPWLGFPAIEPSTASDLGLPGLDLQSRLLGGASGPSEDRPLRGDAGLVGDFSQSAVNSAVAAARRATWGPAPHPPRGTIRFGDEENGPSNPLSAEQQTAYDLFHRTNPRATAEQLDAFYYGLTGSRLQNARNIVRARNRGLGVAPGSTARRQRPNISDVRGRGGFVETTDAIMRGIANVPTLGFDDEISALADTAFRGGSYGENLDRQREINRYDHENHFGARTGGSLAGAFLLPSRAPAAFAQGGVRAGAAQLGREGAAYGGAYGFGSGENLRDRTLGAGTGAALGAPLSYGTGFVLGRLTMPRSAGPRGDTIIRAGIEEGVPISRPIFDPTSRARMAALEASVGGHAPIRQGLEATRRGIEERIGGLATGGVASEQGRMGERIQGAMLDDLRRQYAQIRRLYAEADRAQFEAGAPQILGTEAVQMLDEELNNLRRNPNTNRRLIDFLETVRGDFVDAAGDLIPKRIGDIQQIRASLNMQINRRRLLNTPAEEIVLRVLEAARADVDRGLRDVAPAALRLYNSAEGRQQVIDQTRRQIVNHLVGPADDPISGGAVMARVRDFARNDPSRLRRMWRVLDPQAQRDVAATIAARAGRGSAEDEFSPTEFLAWARSVPPSARQTIFGPEGARSILNLERVARELTAAHGSLSASRTRLGIVDLAGAPFRNLSARALMSTDLTRWLAASAQATSRNAMKARIGRLTAVASRDPAIAQEVLGLQQVLLRAVNENLPRPGQIAASPPSERPDDTNENRHRH